MKLYFALITTVGLVFCNTIVQPCFFSLQWQNSLRLILAFLLEAVFGLFLFFILSFMRACFIIVQPDYIGLKKGRDVQNEGLQVCCIA